MSERWWALPRGHPFSFEVISPAGLDELFWTIDGLTVFRSRTSVERMAAPYGLDRDDGRPRTACLRL